LLVRFHARVATVESDRITLERPLPVGVGTDWTPEVHRLAPSVEDVGIENLTIEFPETSYPGEFNELGYNGIYLLHAFHCFVRNVDILNSDSGVFLRWAHFNTLDQVRIASTNGRGCHHAFNLPFLDSDNLITRFNIEQPCIHEAQLARRVACNPAVVTACIGAAGCSCATAGAHRGRTSLFGTVTMVLGWFGSLLRLAGRRRTVGSGLERRRRTRRTTGSRGGPSSRGRCSGRRARR
jgi:hypothetical protein